MARSVQKILLASRGKVHTELLPVGSQVVRVGHWEGSPYAWVFVDPDAPRNWLVDFLMVADGDRVENEAFWPAGSFSGDGSNGTIWTVLMNWRMDTAPKVELQ
jgi:hypothetical protein